MNNRLNDSLMENSNTDDVSVCRKALECLSLSLCLMPNALETLNQEKHWRTFIVDLVLICGNRIVRHTASEQFLLITLKCSQREICFKWFSKLMTDDPDLEPDMNKTFFVDSITKLDPKLLTDSGIRCFERFFKNVNLKYNRLVQKRHWSLAANGSLNLISSKMNKFTSV